jgi:hypothetical protein
MKVKDTYHPGPDHLDGFICWDTKKIADAIKYRDPEYLKDLYFKNGIHSKIDNFIICRLIIEVLGYDPYDSS